MSDKAKEIFEVVKTGENVYATAFFNTETKEVFQALQTALVQFAEHTSGDVQHVMKAIDETFASHAQATDYKGVFSNYGDNIFETNDLLKVSLQDKNQLNVNIAKEIPYNAIIGAINAVIFAVAQGSGQTVDDVLKDVEKDKIQFSETPVDVGSADGKHIS